MNFWEYFTDEKRAAVKRAIEVAEMETSGEIRVHIENKCPRDPFDRTVDLFARLEMHKTRERNGVLFYVAAHDRIFVVIGDAGINAVVPENFWDEVREVVLDLFRQDKITEGLVAGILLAGKQLSAHFPYRYDDVNELSDEISIGNGD